MADRTRYPQIPGTVWWGLRGILQRTPSATIDERLLGVQLTVQEAAARAYLSELRSVGVLTEEGKATPIAHKWRLDETYADAVNDIIRAVYPENLIHLAPPGQAERRKVVSWFEREGLGQGAAGNKAATYLLLSSPTPNEAPRAESKQSPSDSPQKRISTRNHTGSVAKQKPPHLDQTYPANKQDNSISRGAADAYPLNVNVQIHISADAGTEQIESIFKAMRQYLNEPSNS